MRPRDLDVWPIDLEMTFWVCAAKPNLNFLFELFSHSFVSVRCKSQCHGNILTWSLVTLTFDTVTFDLLAVQVNFLHIVNFVDNNVTEFRNCIRISVYEFWLITHLNLSFEPKFELHAIFCLWLIGTDKHETVGQTDVWCFSLQEGCIQSLQVSNHVDLFAAEFCVMMKMKTMQIFAKQTDGTTCAYTRRIENMIRAC